MKQLDKIVFKNVQLTKSMNIPDAWTVKTTSDHPCVWGELWGSTGSGFTLSVFVLLNHLTHGCMGSRTSLHCAGII